jgi:hypothetical protein
MIRKAITILLTLGTVATGVLWLDSYRARKPRPLTDEEQRILSTDLVNYARSRPDPMSLGGVRSTHRLGNRRIIRVRTCAGTLTLRYDSGIKTGTPVPRKDVGFWGFRHKQWMWRSSTRRGKDGMPDIHDDYRVREITFPFAALFPALAFYPALALFRGPLRRWRCRRKGLCLTCGYNLMGNVTGVCSECGTKFEPS